MKADEGDTDTIKPADFADFDFGFNITSLEKVVLQVGQERMLNARLCRKNYSTSLNQDGILDLTLHYFPFLLFRSYYLVYPMISAV